MRELLEMSLRHEGERRLNSNRIPIGSGGHALVALTHRVPAVALVPIPARCLSSSPKRALLARPRPFRRGRFAGECSVLATVGAADSGSQRGMAVAWLCWQERSVNQSRELHHNIGHVFLQNVAGRLFRLPQLLSVWR